MHVTLRAAPGLSSFRGPRVFAAIRDALRAAQKARFRICHFSVQSNHIHMLVEANDRQALSRGVQGLASRVARAVNRVLARRGPVWADRHNVKRHQPGFAGLDPCSSARWFFGGQPDTPHAAPVRPPRTWLLGAAWRRAGPVRVEDVPVGA